MLKEGQIRIPSGCAISGIFSKSGKPVGGDAIVRSIAVMHDRSNGLGGGFAGYGIYPEYKDYYAFHVFYDSDGAGAFSASSLRVLRATLTSTSRSCWEKTSADMGWLPVSQRRMAAMKASSKKVM